MTQEFIASIDAFGARAKRNAHRIFQQSALDVMEEMLRLKDYPSGDVREPPEGAVFGGRMPYKTGALWNSAYASLEGGAQGDYQLVIAGAPRGANLRIGLSAAHAAPLEYGVPSRNIEPHGFARHAADMWRQIVSKNAREVANG